MKKMMTFVFIFLLAFVFATTQASAVVEGETWYQWDGPGLYSQYFNPSTFPPIYGGTWQEEGLLVWPTSNHAGKISTSLGEGNQYETTMTCISGGLVSNPDEGLYYQERYEGILKAGNPWFPGLGDMAIKGIVNYSIHYDTFPFSVSPIHFQTEGTVSADGINYKAEWTSILIEDPLQRILVPPPIGNYAKLGGRIDYAELKIHADGDGDGAQDNSEWGPEGTDLSYDGNGDGIPDSSQDIVSSFMTEGGYLTIESTDGGILSEVKAIPLSEVAWLPEDWEFPWGLLKYNVTPIDGKATVIIYLPPGSNPTTYYKLGITPTNSVIDWYEFPPYLCQDCSGWEIDGDRIILHLVDGAIGDNDGLVNGKIEDPGAPVIPTVDITPPGQILPADIKTEYTGESIELGEVKTYDFHCGDDVVTTNNAPEGNIFPLGVTEVTYISTDCNGNVTIGVQTVTIVDTTPPTISEFMVSPDVLTPPNNKFRPITITKVVLDLADPNPTVTMKVLNSEDPTADASSEYTIDPNDATRKDDWFFSSIDGMLYLRAERLGSGNGRTYTIILTAKDASGNFNTAERQVFVPHDMGKLTTAKIRDLLMCFREVPNLLIYTRLGRR